MDSISSVNTQVAQFLRVNPEAGLFFFDSSYRPVPLAQQYVGISEQNYLARNELLNEICYKKVCAFDLGSFECNLLECQYISLWYFLCQIVDSLRQGHQAMVFVHSRKDTAKTAQKLVYPSTFQLNVINLDVFLPWTPFYAGFHS